MKARTVIVTAFALIILFTISGCSSSAEEPGTSFIDWNDRDHRAEQFVAALVNEDYSVATDGFDAVMKKGLSADALKESWDEMIAEAGAFISIAGTEIVPHDEYDIYEVISQHENKRVNTRIVFSSDGLVAGLFFSFVDNPGEWDSAPVQKEGYTEIPVVIGEGSDYPLRGIISMPDNAPDKIPAVVLVHGSGPIDIDGTAFGITVFKDIAEHLAQNGIAVLRYDKRTYSYGAELSAQYGDNLTVREETIDDAIAAKAILIQDGRIDENRVFVLGHSLGGMLTPRIVSEGGFAGGIILAGSPRSLLDIIYDQNIYFIGLMDTSDDERNALYKQVDEARETFFTLPEAYITEMDAHPAEGYLSETDKPFLIMQGSKDFQVLADVDFALYQEYAQGRENIEFRLYKGLNHLFTDSTMENPTTDDYVPGSSVNLSPLSDIVEWVKRND